MKRDKEIKYLVGIDEAGRGPLAGPIALGAFCVSVDNKTFRRFSKGVRDSKKMSEEQRDEWYEKILVEQGKQEEKLIYAVSFASAEMIDEKGVTFATKYALANALKKLKCRCHETLVLLDGGLRAPKEYLFQKTIIHGDDIEPIISLASIVAKVSRDKKMYMLAKKYPEYGFEKHKGYGTKMHYERIEQYGIIEGIHRKRFLGSILNSKPL